MPPPLHFREAEVREVSLLGTVQAPRQFLRGGKARVQATSRRSRQPADWPVNCEANSGSRRWVALHCAAAHVVSIYRLTRSAGRRSIQPRDGPSCTSSCSSSVRAHAGREAHFVPALCPLRPLSSLRRAGAVGELVVVLESSPYRGREGPRQGVDLISGHGHAVGCSSPAGF